MYSYIIAKGEKIKSMDAQQHLTYADESIGIAATYYRWSLVNYSINAYIHALLYVSTYPPSYSLLNH